MNSFKNLFILFGVIVLNSLLFGTVDFIFVQSLQLLLAIIGIVILTIMLLDLESNLYFKKYSIPLYITFFIGVRSTESLIAKYLERNFADLYLGNKFSIYIGLFCVFLAIIFWYNNKKKRKAL